MTELKTIVQMPSRARLGVNVDHVATLRQARGTAYPDPLDAALISEVAGADQITVHLREDRRHIQDHDVYRIRRAIRSLLNLEMAASEEMVKIALDVGPNIVTLVPERREERTTEGGLDVVRGGEILRGFVKTLSQAGIEVSLFVDPDPVQIQASFESGAQAIELHTGDYCLAPEGERAHHLKLLREAAYQAHGLGLRVAAGHGLDAHNIGPVAGILPIGEFNVGHSIVSRAVFVGFEGAVQELLGAIVAGRAVSAP